ncbi:hypothetical protein PM082_024017 [Marasmius tenuissimus]|nr:hypothetical protein PM082_024017 [Marasmius tenuissimus]
MSAGHTHCAEDTLNDRAYPSSSTNRGSNLARLSYQAEIIGVSSGVSQRCVHLKAPFSHHFKVTEDPNP